MFTGRQTVVQNVVQRRENVFTEVCEVSNSCKNVRRTVKKRLQTVGATQYKGVKLTHPVRML